MNQLPLQFKKSRIEYLIYMQPHKYRELVNQLRDLSIAYHDHQSLRDRISHLLSEYITVQGK